MNRITSETFEPISINGRFIYGYLCLRNVINTTASSSLPPGLEELFHEFVVSDRLDEWQGKVDEILPSYILGKERDRTVEYFEIAEIEKIREYYIHQPAFVVELIEELFWLGLSNLYGGYNSKITMGHLKIILDIMKEHAITLPDFVLIKHCLISKGDAWGERDNLQHYYK